MKRKIASLILVLCALSLFAQKNLVDGYIVLESNDTLAGKLKNKSYYSASGVKLFQDGIKIRYSKSIISEVHIDSYLYVKSASSIWSKAFFKKEYSGEVNLYTYKKKRYLGVYDSDLNMGRIKPGLKYYCSDYPNVLGEIRHVDEYNAELFLERYSNWKKENPNSLSYYEENMHHQPRVNLKLSFLSPGVGFEFGISEKFSISTMFKNDFGYHSSYGFFIVPYVNSQLRYYHNIDKRKMEKKRTYKYSGNYFSLIHALFVVDNSMFVGLEYGWQRTIGKHFYYNVGLGAAKWIGNNNISLLHDIDLGYNF